MSRPVPLLTRLGLGALLLASWAAPRAEVAVAVQGSAGQSFAAFLAMFELVLLLGNVASEWLNLAQGPLNWTEQNDAFTIPGILVLQNEVGVSWGAIKDFISINYNMAALTAIILFAWKIQEWGQPLPEIDPSEADQVSPYGRPLVKGAS